MDCFPLSRESKLKVNYRSDKIIIRKYFKKFWPKRIYEREKVYKFNINFFIIL